MLWVRVSSELEIQKLEFEIQELASKAELNKAKADEAQADADNAKLEFVETETGTKHERDMEKQAGQAQGNQNLAVTKALVTPRKRDQTEPDIEAAVGFNEISNGARQLGGGRPAPLPEQLPDMPPILPPLAEEFPIDPQLSSQ